MMLRTAAICAFMVGCAWAVFFASPWFWLGVVISLTALAAKEAGE